MTLVRPTRLYGDEQVLARATQVTKDRFGSVATVYVMCEQDQVVKQDFQKLMVQKHPNTQHINIIVSGADHMIMFSNPQYLSSQLEHIATTYF